MEAVSTVEDLSLSEESMEGFLDAVDLEYVSTVKGLFLTAESMESFVAAADNCDQRVHKTRAC